MALDRKPTPRTQARRQAVDLLFEADQRGRDPLQLAEGRDVPQYTLDLLEGVKANQAALDEMVETFSQGWPRANMPAYDRAVLALGAFEVVFEDDVPDQVAIKEAADLAGAYSTPKSPGFVSGLLGRLSDLKDTLR